MATAYLTFILVLLYYFLGYVEAKDLNHIDRELLAFCTRKKFDPSSTSSLKTWKPAIEKIIMTFSDQQIITGLAILASGYSQLSCGGVDTYHWQIMVFLAWFSSLTHLTTLTILRHYFRTDNPKAKAVRMVLMFLTLVLLVAALLPTRIQVWLRAPSEPALCYYQRNGHGQESDYYGGSIDALASFAISVVVLVASYFTRAIKLFATSSDSCRYLVQTVPANWTKARIDSLDQGSLGWRILSDILLVQIVLFRSLAMACTSMFWEVRHTLESFT